MWNTTSSLCIHFMPPAATPHPKLTYCACQNKSWQVIIKMEGCCNSRQNWLTHTEKQTKTVNFVEGFILDRYLGKQWKWHWWITHLLYLHTPSLFAITEVMNKWHQFLFPCALRLHFWTIKYPPFSLFLSLACTAVVTAHNLTVPTITITAKNHHYTQSNIHWTVVIQHKWIAHL
jgi:hypothetical protein